MEERATGRQEVEDVKTFATDVTGLLLVCFVVIFFYHLCFLVLFQTKLLSRLKHKVCRLLYFPVLLHKFTINGISAFDGMSVLTWRKKGIRIFSCFVGILTIAIRHVQKSDPYSLNVLITRISLLTSELYITSIGCQQSVRNDRVLSFSFY